MSKPHPTLKKEVVKLLSKDWQPNWQNETASEILALVAKHLPKDWSKYWVDEETPYIHVDKLLIDMVYLIQGYDHDQDCTELDREAVNRTKREILALVDSRVAEARIDELKQVMTVLGLTGDQRADKTLTVEEIWSSLVQRKKTLEAEGQNTPKGGDK